jgi:AcrR family transcriptional regulator
VAKPLHQLSPRHHQAVALRLAGERPQAIADSLGVERRTVYLWFSDPLVKQEVDRRVRDVAALLTERLADHTLSALDRLGEVVDLPLDATSLTVAQKLEVIREILDRCAYTVRVPPSAPSPIWQAQRGK